MFVFGLLHFGQDFNPHPHAGSDCNMVVSVDSENISIHTPTQGVTFDLQQKIQEDNISIHTPTQGVTWHSKV